MTTQSARLVRVETKLEDMCSKLDTHITDQRKDFDKVIAKIDTLGTKFAGKWVEKVALGVLVAAIGGLIILIIQVI